jgi:hypothetical protein
MSRFTTSYNPTGGASASGDNDYKDRDGLLLDKFAVIEFTLARVGSYGGQFGEQIILNMDDVQVNEGVISERESDGKTKVWGWDQWFDRDPATMELVPYDDDGEITTAELPRRKSEDAGRNTFRYELGEGVLEGRDEPVEIGDRELWLKNQAKSRTVAKVLSTEGENIIEDKDDDNNWLSFDVGNEEFPLREELEGRRLILWFQPKTFTVEKGDEEEEVTYIDAFILDAETEAGITMINEESGEQSTIPEPTAEEADESSDTSSAEEGFPQEIEELIEVFRRTEQTSRESIEPIVQAEAPDGYDVDMDAVMDAVTA